MRSFHHIATSFPTNDTLGAKPFLFQPKLAITSPDYPFEREGDAAADKVIRIKTPFIPPKAIPVSPVQRKCAHCEEEEKKQIQRKEESNDQVLIPRSFERYETNLNGGGMALPNEVRNFYEPRFGYDLGNVKVHTDTAAAKSAQSINALAYTSGNNIVFNEGQYSPHTDSGRRLLAHELTHTVQQKGRPGAIQRLVKRSLVTNCENQSDKAFNDLKTAEQNAFDLLRKGIKRIDIALEQYADAVHIQLIPDENDLKKFDEAYKVGRHLRTAFGFPIGKSSTWDMLRIIRVRFMATLGYLNSVYFDYNCCENGEKCPKLGNHQCTETRFAIVREKDDPNLIVLCPTFWESPGSRGLTLAHEIMHLWGRGLIKDSTTEVFGIVKETPSSLDANRYEKFLRLLNS